MEIQKKLQSIQMTETIIGDNGWDKTTIIYTIELATTVIERAF